MLLDHITIRRDAAQLAGTPPLKLLHDLGARLADHVALEEHQVFPLIEAAIPETELQALSEPPVLSTSLLSRSLRRGGGLETRIVILSLRSDTQVSLPPTERN